VLARIAVPKPRAATDTPYPLVTRVHGGIREQALLGISPLSSRSHAFIIAL
jgi:hypothetical protein